MASVLFIGGTGLISSECAALAARQGWEVCVLNRGHRAAPEGTTGIVADIARPEEVRAAVGGRWFDVVANFIAYKPEDVARDVDLFWGRCGSGRKGQYVLVSSCACYQKPPGNYRVDERTPLLNPFWGYAQLKIACEEMALKLHRERGVPVTIVRPSLTYGVSRIPAAYHNSAYSWTTAQRFLTGKPVIVHGDGTGLWQITHAADFAKGFVGLLGNAAAIGEAFNITTDEVLRWDEILTIQAELLGVKANLIHIPTDFIARFDPAKAAGLYGDKCHAQVIDNAKIKRVVAGFAATMGFREGLAGTLAWFRADAARQAVDAAHDALADRIVAAWRGVRPG
jgi:nucleoside-diphosphate-sugar epimerase